MKSLCTIVCLAAVLSASAQPKTAHNMVYGRKPDTKQMMQATQVENYLGKRTRISTTLQGRMIKVTNPRGGWFDMDAGNGHTISAHFSDPKVNLPVMLKGKTIIAEGVIQKQLTPDEGQHFAGGGSQKHEKVDPNRMLTFEVKGMRVF